MLFRSVLTVTTSTTIESACVSTAAAPNRALAVDIDGANGQDLIVSVTGGIKVLKNNGLGALVAQSTITTGAGAAGLAVADFDGDTFLDVAVANRDAGTVTVLYGDGTGAFPASFSINAGGPAVAVAACRTVGAYPDLIIAVAGTRLCAAGNLRNVSTVAGRAFQNPITLSTGNFVEIGRAHV